MLQEFLGLDQFYYVTDTGVIILFLNPLILSDLLWFIFMDVTLWRKQQILSYAGMEILDIKALPWYDSNNGASMVLPVCIALTAWPSKWLWSSLQLLYEILDSASAST